ncbi:MAG: DUF2997 domain-containing protein [Deltaproteobacteria bacterium]|jgi:hypothetical protein|nr:DUF2997 domain-containing protein [Deltaproteobacteria bacterium]
MKQIIIDIAGDGEIKITTKGYPGHTCIEETKFLRDLLGREIERELAPVASVEGEEEVKQFIPICG